MWWLEHKSAERILILLTDGELIWDASAGDFDWRRTTAVSRIIERRFGDEPLHVDLGWAQLRPAALAEVALNFLSFETMAQNLNCSGK